MVRSSWYAECTQAVIIPREKCGGTGISPPSFFQLTTMHRRNCQVLQTAEPHVRRALQSTRAIARILLVGLLQIKKSSHSCELRGVIWRTRGGFVRTSNWVYCAGGQERALEESPSLERISPTWLHRPSRLFGEKVGAEPPRKVFFREAAAIRTRSGPCLH